MKANMNRIADSELIINSRGAVYHIDMRPEELADTVITVGDPDRVDAVSKYFDSIEYRLHHREFNAHRLYWQKRLTVISTGIGPDNVDIVMNELDAVANIDFESHTVNKALRSLNIFRIGTWFAAGRYSNRFICCRHTRHWYRQPAELLPAHE